MKAEKMPDCLLPLKGAVNFRDMGGLKTSNGRIVKNGILFRAAELTGLTEEDMNVLETIEFKTVFDYRRDNEAIRKPDPVIGHAINERVPVMKDDNLTSQLYTKEGVLNKEYYSRYRKEGFMAIYEKMPIQNQSYKRLMMLLKEPEKNLPLVHHCTGGRDRTGVGAMIILMTLGVPFETVLEDYLLSNVTLFDFHNKIFDKVSSIYSKEELNSFKEGFILQEEYLYTALNSINKNYDNFDNYLIQEFGINEEKRNRIMNYCLY